MNTADLKQLRRNAAAADDRLFEFERGPLHPVSRDEAGLTCRPAEPYRHPGHPPGPMRATLPYPVGVNNATAVVRGRKVKSAKARAYKSAAGAAALAAGMRPLAGLVRVSAVLYRPRRCGDVDGPTKALLDALSGIAYADDAQVVRLEVTRRDDKARPRVEVEVEPWEDNDDAR